MTMTAMAKTSWYDDVRPARVAAALSVAAALFAAPGTAAAEAPYMAENLADVCRTALDPLPETAPEDTQAAASACADEMTTAWGAEDPRLVSLYGDLAGVIARTPRQANASLPLRRRADALAADLYGDESLEAGEAALATVRTMILAGRCDGADPAFIEPLERARVAFISAPSSDRRRFGLSGVAAAYADARLYDAAEETILVLAGELDARDWRRIAGWRDSTGDVAGADQALMAAIDSARGRMRARTLEEMRGRLVARGDFEALANLPSE